MQNVLFVHVPKTAGTSLRKMFEDKYTPDLVFPNEKCLSEHPGVYYDEPVFERVFGDSVDKYVFISAHLSYNVLRSKFSQQPFTVTVLRNPLKRALSEILHHKMHGAEELREMSFDQIIFERPHLYSGVIRYFGLSLEEAKHNLGRFDVVGIQEQFTDSLKLLSKLLGWEQVPTMRKDNVTPETADMLSVRALQRLSDRLHENFLLYSHACELFRQKYRAAFGVYP